MPKATPVALPAGLLVAVLVTAWFEAPLARQRTMPVSEVRAGMTGVGRTVFNGTAVEPFEVEILGVLRHAVGPQRHLILARLNGGPLARTGVIAGMSGSPVRVDGRLVGAVAYAIGSFSTEPIAGITPFDEMREATFDAPRRPRRPPAVTLHPPFDDAAVRTAIRTLVTSGRPFAERIEDLDVVAGASGHPAVDRQIGTRLRPIATPLSLSGFGAEAIGLVASWLGEAGFTTVSGGQRPPPADRAGPTGAEAPLGPGDAIGIDLVGGDLTIGATGTVTAVEGRRVYAFGHPLYTLGPVALPMTRAYVHAILPSLASSTKLASTGEVVGTLVEDRTTGVAGLLGIAPPTIPVEIALDQGGGQPRTFRFRVARDQAFTPLLIYVTVANVLAAHERQTGALTIGVRGTIGIAGHEAIAIDEAFTGPSAVTAATSAVAGPITLLMANDEEPAEVASVTLAVSTAERTASWVLDRAWLDDPRPKPGRTVALKVTLRPYRGEPVVHTVPIEIPASAPERMTIQIAAGAELARNDERDARWPDTLRGVTAIVGALNGAPRSTCLYVRLLAPSPGVVVDGTRFPGLPPSALAVYDADRNGSTTTSLRATVVGQWVIALDGAVAGSRTLPIDLAVPR